ncbi:MAG TPA: gephyrin-like molybdotransferase Glp [Acidimicrobiales bacterium]|nr:gephyrin-like molybdotransferase Glp [Acidimicrobiales bacterium]
MSAAVPAPGAGLVPLADAQRRVLAQCRPLRPLAVPLAEALGCVTSVDIVAEEAVPPWANSAVDGFAVRAADVAAAPVTLPVTATIRAGAPPEPAVGAGEAVRILTGAPLPPGADAVVMVEDTDVWDGRTGREAVGAATVPKVEVRRAVGVGANVRAAGDDIRAGQTVFAAGTVLGPGHLGVLASIGMRRVPVFPRARVGVLSTGDELVDSGERLRPGQIRDSNRRTLLALAAEANCEPVDLGHAPDDEAAVRDALTDALGRCDAVMTSGGVSVGDFDYVKVVLDELSGGAFAWMQVAIRPAKPLAFGVARGTPVFGLPGNPVSSMVSFELFARPALRAMMGHTGPARPEVVAVADGALTRRPDGKLHLARVRARWGADGRVHVLPLSGQASHHLHAMAEANALALVPDGDGAAAGADVRAVLLADPDPAP